MFKMAPAHARALGVVACLCAGIALVAAATPSISTEGGSVRIKSGAGISMEVCFF